MPWATNACADKIYGSTLGIVNGIFGLSFFTKDETDEITSLKKWALLATEKVPDITTDPAICASIRNSQKSGLTNFYKTTLNEMVAAGSVNIAELVYNKNFNERFKEILMGARINLIGC
jgi:hypothetical protein